MKSKLNDTKLLKANDAHFKRLNTLFSGRKSQKILFLNGTFGTSDSDPYQEPERWVSEALESLANQADQILDPLVFRPLCLEFGPYGVHFIDKILGAEVFYQDGQWYNNYLSIPAGELTPPDLENNEAWLLAKRIAKSFVEQNLSLPLFGLPTIASALNIAVNLYGEKILLEMHVEPDHVKHDLKIINELLCYLHHWYLNHIPIKQLQPVVSAFRSQPPGFGQICGCTTQLISPQMYREFIAPLDEEVLSVYPNGGMIHLCGRHIQHIPVWREMKPLRAVQINDRAALDLEVYYKELREDQIIYLNPCDGMGIEQAISITGGHRIVIVTDPDKPF